MSILCVLLLSIICSVLASEGSDYKQQCESSTMKLVLQSHYNQTGNWQSKVVFNQHKYSPLDEDTSNQWSMDIHQTSSVCDEGKSTLETTIYLTAPVLKTIVVSQESTIQHSAAPTIAVIPQEPLTATVEQLQELPKPSKLVKKDPAGYELYPGVGYYKFHHGVTAWPAARDQCAQEGGHLVIINSPAEREVVRQLFAVLNPSSPGSSNPDQIHAGLERTSSGAFATIFGVPIEKTGFSEWYPGQPSSGASEPCTSIMVQNISYNDISCSKQKLAFICEIEL